MKRIGAVRKLDAICAAMMAAGMEVDQSDPSNGGTHYLFKGDWYRLPLVIRFDASNGNLEVFSGLTGGLIADTAAEDPQKQKWCGDLLDALSLSDVFYEPGSSGTAEDLAHH